MSECPHRALEDPPGSTVTEHWCRVESEPGFVWVCEAIHAAGFENCAVFHRARADAALASLAGLRTVAEGVAAQLKVADQCITMLRSELGSLIREDMAMAHAGSATQAGNQIALAAWKKANP